MARLPRLCFLGFGSLSVLAREHNQHGIGGEEVQHTLLAKAFARRGYPVSMIVSDYGQPDGAEWEGVKTWKAYRPGEGLPILRFAYPRWWKLVAALDRASPDVVYVSCAGAHLGQVVLWAKRRNKRVIFRVAHDRDCHPGALILPRSTYWRDRRLYEFGLRHADHVLVQTEAQRRAMLENYGKPSVIARMLVDEQPAGRLLEKRDIDVLWVNNVRQFKRPDLFIELSRRLTGYRVHMVGGPQPNEAALFRETEYAAKSIPQLTFHGQVPYHAVNDLFSRARVFVNTSDTEGFPNAYLQAWIRGTPVVAFFDPDHLIRTAKLGESVSSLEEMFSEVRRLLSVPEAWSVTSKKCESYMATEFNEGRTLEPYEAALVPASSRFQPQP